MDTLAGILVVIFGLIALHLILSIVVNILPAPKDRGRWRDGIILFVEPTRFAFLRWGWRGLVRSLSLAGVSGRVFYWPWQRWWHGTAIWPALRSPSVHRRSWQRLARQVRRIRQRRGDLPICLVGYSAGAWVVVQALEHLGPGWVDQALLIAPAFSCRYDLDAACQAADGQLTLTASCGDWLLLGLGTTLLGTADGLHRPAAGMLGPRQNHACRCVRWQMADLLAGHLAGHLWACHARWLASKVWPSFGLRRGDR